MRGHQGRDLYGLPDLDQEQKLQVAKDTLIAIRVARLAAAFAEQGWPFLIEQPARRDGQPHMFNLPEFLHLLRIPGVRLRTFLQCPVGARTMKPTIMMYMAARMPKTTYSATCYHPARWFRYLDDGQWVKKRHPTLMGKRRMVDADLYEGTVPNPSSFVSKEAEAYPA